MPNILPTCMPPMKTLGLFVPAGMKNASATWSWPASPGSATSVCSSRPAPMANSVCWDLDPKAVGLATDRLADIRHARVERARLPADWPGGRFDLIVLSEVGYYLDPTDWLQVIEQSVASLSYDGGLLACHWKHPIAGCPQDGREVHRMLSKHLPLYPVFCHDEADFIMAYWSNQPSVVDLDETCV